MQSSGLSMKGLNVSRGWDLPIPEVLSLAGILIIKESKEIIMFESCIAARVCILCAIVRARSVINFLDIISSERFS